MKSKEDAEYRLRLTEGFLKEAIQDFELSRWRSCVDNSQLSVENSGKTIIACFKPVEKTHDPTKQVSALLENKEIHPDLVGDVSAIIQMMGELGFEEHFMTDYGNENDYKDPWELFQEDDAKEALEFAKECAKIAREVYEFYFCSQ